MGFNYAEEYKKWLVWKEEEEELLRTLKVPESTIKELRTYDWNEFKRERSIVSRQVPTKEIFFVVRPIHATQMAYCQSPFCQSNFFVGTTT